LNESAEAATPHAPGRVNNFPIRLVVKCVDKPGEKRGVVILEAGADQGRLMLKVANPSTYEQFFVGRTYHLVLYNGDPRSELVEGDGGATG
jgi:hypothetical protein